MTAIKAVFRFPYAQTPEPMERIYRDGDAAEIRNRLREYDIMSIEVVESKTA
jgi:hypothetical protein